MTTTTTFKGVDPNSRKSSRVLRPPGGGSNFSLGFDEPTEQPVRKNKMASSIFGTPEENPPSWAKSAGAKSSEGREELESSGRQRRNSSEASSGDFFDLKGEGDIHENVDTDLQGSLGQNLPQSTGTALAAPPRRVVCMQSSLAMPCVSVPLAKASSYATWRRPVPHNSLPESKEAAFSFNLKK
ncbi:Hematological and neurological expressed 1 protein [Sciurus carolinensis]|uniref:Hematological and neurological expressed 1 protein n=1 Tax=Sciurus carolinensis TaxID=30640 RepID=A0AA41N861_SCICA|nr:Hematological and neurological expressed 1 protein [Sciurus carolinensis]